MENGKKYFIVSEGLKTEPIYFNELSKNRRKLNIDKLIKIVTVAKDYGERNWSNPKKIFNRFQQKLKEHESGEFTCWTIKNYIMKFLLDNELISSNVSEDNVWNEIRKFNKDKDAETKSKTNEIKQFCESVVEILSKYNVNCSLRDIYDYIISQNIFYDSGKDKICFVCDRDYQSFKSNQYDEVVSSCKENKYGLYVTNPCIELWFLMHFDDVCEIDRDKILKNEKNGRKRFLEKELTKRLGSYSKKKYDVEKLVLKIDTAIENEKNFCENLIGLEEEIGSNIGVLIEEMREV